MQIMLVKDTLGVQLDRSIGRTCAQRLNDWVLLHLKSQSHITKRLMTLVWRKRKYRKEKIEGTFGT